MPTVNYDGRMYETVELIHGFQWVLRDFPDREGVWHWSDFNDVTNQYTYYVYIDNTRLLALRNTREREACDYIDFLSEARDRALRELDYRPFTNMKLPTIHIRWNDINGGRGGRFEWIKIKYAVMFNKGSVDTSMEFDKLDQAFKFYKGLAFPHMAVEKASVLEIQTGVEPKVIRSCKKE